ncbi:hypothetical protein BT69DRAFT_335101 [Atractiella rhizophila]|nr:hypothetical protein BT69DRAFT_335101 [Atractiella rhizophila]
MAARRRPLPPPPQPSTSALQPQPPAPTPAPATQAPEPRRRSIEKPPLDENGNFPASAHAEPAGGVGSEDAHPQGGFSEDDLVGDFDVFFGDGRLPAYGHPEPPPPPLTPAPPSAPLLPTSNPTSPTNSSFPFSPTSGRRVLPTVPNRTPTTLTIPSTAAPTPTSGSTPSLQAEFDLTSPLSSPHPGLGGGAGADLNRAPSYRTATRTNPSVPPPVPSLPPEYIPSTPAAANNRHRAASLVSTASPPNPNVPMPPLHHHHQQTLPAPAVRTHGPILPSFHPNAYSSPYGRNETFGKMMFQSATGGKTLGFYNHSVGGLLGENQMTNLPQSLGGGGGGMKGKGREIPPPLPTKPVPTRQGSVQGQGTYMVAVSQPMGPGGSLGMPPQQQQISPSPFQTSHSIPSPPASSTSFMPSSTAPTTAPYPSYSTAPIRPSPHPYPHTAPPIPTVGSPEPIVPAPQPQRFSNPTPGTNMGMAGMGGMGGMAVSTPPRPPPPKRYSSDGSHTSSISSEALTIRRTAPLPSGYQPMTQHRRGVGMGMGVSSQEESKAVEEEEILNDGYGPGAPMAGGGEDDYWRRVREVQAQQNPNLHAPSPSASVSVHPAITTRPLSAPSAQVHAQGRGRGQGVPMAGWDPDELAGQEEGDEDDEFEGGGLTVVEKKNLIKRKKKLQALLGEELEQAPGFYSLQGEGGTNSTVGVSDARSVRSGRSGSLGGFGGSSSNLPLPPLPPLNTIPSTTFAPPLSATSTSTGEDAGGAGGPAYESYSSHGEFLSTPSSGASAVASSLLSRFARSSSASSNQSGSSLDRSFSVSSGTYSPLSPIRDSVSPFITSALSKINSLNNGQGERSSSREREVYPGTDRRRRVSSRSSLLSTGGTGAAIQPVGAKRNDNTSPESLMSLPEGAEMENLAISAGFRSGYGYSPNPNRESTTSLPAGFGGTISPKHSLAALARANSVKSAEVDRRNSARSTGKESFISEGAQRSPLESEYDSSRDSHAYAGYMTDVLGGKALNRNSSGGSKSSGLFVDPAFGGDSSGERDGSLSRNTSLSSGGGAGSQFEEDSKGSTARDSFTEEAYRHDITGSLLYAPRIEVDQLSLPDIQGIGLSIDPFAIKTAHRQEEEEEEEELETAREKSDNFTEGQTPLPLHDSLKMFPLSNSPPSNSTIYADTNPGSS